MLVLPSLSSIAAREEKQILRFDQDDTSF